MKEGLIHRISALAARKLGLSQGAVFRARHRLERLGSGVDVCMGVLTFVAALGAVVCLLIYTGFDNTPEVKAQLLALLHAAQTIFVLGIVADVLFSPRPQGVTGLVHIVADLMIILTVVPIFLPKLAEAHYFGVMFHRRFFLCAILVYSIAEICGGVMRLLGRRTNPSLILSGSFVVFILAGTFVLMLPKCHNGNLEFADALFVASSAVSMTGLTTVDISTAFTPMGWWVLGILMQIGALGVLTFTSFFSLFFTGRPSIYNQLLMRDFIYSKSMSALVPMLLYILAFTLCVEAIGAVGIYFTMPARLFDSVAERIGCSAFHAIAAFTNSGLSTLPDGLANRALFGGNQLLYLVMATLIFAGGIGFPILVNFKDAVFQYLQDFKDFLLRRPYRRRRVHIYDLNTKIVLYTTVILFIAGVVGFYVLERHNSLEGMPGSKQVIQSIFYSATARSAGFAPINPAGFLNITLMVLMFLMWVGGASQSMAGGIKVNAFGTAILNLRSLICNNRGVVAFDRRISVDSVRRANGTIVLSVISLLTFIGAVVIAEPHLGLKAVVFECVSAVTTNGLSLGITAELSTCSKILLSTAMFLGRVGLLSVLAGLAHKNTDTSRHFPADEVIIS